MLFAVFGFGFLGLVDDLAAVGEDRGFHGHLGALREGRVTTGMLKLVGGAAVAIVLVATPGFKSGARSSSTPCSSRSPPTSATCSTARRAARSSSGWWPTCPSRSPSAAAPIGIAIAPVMGAAFGLLGDDLHERLMLGDTGANVIGAVLGLAVVLGSRDSIRLGGDAGAARAQRRRRAGVVQPGDRRGAAAALVRPPRPSPHRRTPAPVRAAVRRHGRQACLVEHGDGAEVVASVALGREPRRRDPGTARSASATTRPRRRRRARPPPSPATLR